ncbi:hypothetical protein PS718_02271 [Pseudomonas fluorescens]|uniref:Uncharacterized protein n=1 Tax=Pseudomonas fluorescens TaxID=294 RepID=A0A5E7C747_PSEFL|nr:hypothetical protein [Pseudomonas fluorescens]VVN95984.1 hypothetical protein PS718_02271 [Pseudomonas fluorescens]
MAERIYRKLEGMTLEYLSGQLEPNPKERAIRYTVSFEMDLDFTHFVQMANVYIPGYLNNPINAIRPELDGLAYHYSYNYLFDAANNIRDNEALFRLFTSPSYYMDQWAEGKELQVRYGKPRFEQVGRKLRITAHRDFRLLDQARQIEIGDLPIIPIHWALNLMQGHTLHPEVVAPISRVVLMYMDEDFVEVDGQQMYRGTRYINGKQLGFGEITAKQVLTA